MSRFYFDWKQAVRTISTAVLCLILYILIVCAMCGCTTTKIVEVPKIHEVHHHHTDSVIKVDSVTNEKETVIMQLDSAEMAKYGIQLKSAERAWLVKTKELEMQIQRLIEASATKDSVHDTIPVPYPVEKEVPAEISWWQGTIIRLGYLFMFIVAGGIIWIVIKKRLLKN